MLVVAAALSLTSPASSKCNYTVTVIPEMDCGLWQSPIHPIAINISGVVLLVGDDCSNGNARSFWWQEGLKELQPIPMPPGVISLRASDISDDGLVVGGMGGLSPVGELGFVFDLNTQQFIAQIPAPAGGDLELTAINQTGFACGLRKTNASDPNSSTAIIYEIATGELIDLGKLGGDSSTAVAINNLNTVTGIVIMKGLPQGFLWQEGEIAILQSLFGYSSGPSAMNDAQTIAGGASFLIANWPFQSTVACQWKDGQLTNLGLVRGDTDSVCRDINDAGVIVGTSRFLSMSTTIWRGVIWVDGQLYELTNLVAGMPANTTIDVVYAINDVGQIVGYSHTPGQQNDVATVVLTPIAESGDITGDCTVDVDDLLRVINEWGDSNSAADLDESGTVDVSDLMIVIENWTFK